MNNEKQTSQQPEKTFDAVDMVEVSNATTCRHHFVMKGFRVCECMNCHMGLLVDSVDDFKKLVETYGNVRK